MKIIAKVFERSVVTVFSTAVVMVAGARSADDWPPDDARWRAAQNELAAGSTHGRVVVVDGGHYLPLELPERVASEVAALLDLVRR